ncbi:MAG: hypothetical protein KC422_20080 [Trueperaceae bacterium]|nr:hypothetical protein [Trueperaceae bacterium]
MKYVILSLLLSLGLAAAQDSRSIAMGGVMLPDRSSTAVNPAYSADGIPGQAYALPLPLGALNALTQDSFNPASSSLDVLPILDQVNNLSSYIINLPASPTEHTIKISANEEGQAVLSYANSGGADLIFGLSDIGYGVDYAIPINFAAGPVRVGVRPYVFLNTVVSPDAEMAKLFAGGTNQGGATAQIKGEAGVSLDVFYATLLPNELFGESDFNGDIYVGVRAAPFVGLARVDGNGAGQIEATDINNVSFDYEAQGFVSTVATGQIGYGLVTDLGVATVIPVDAGKLNLGLSLSNFGLAIWSGDSYTMTGGSSAGAEFSSPTAETKAYFSPNFGVHANGAYETELASNINMLVAADAGYALGAFETHLGTETLFGLSDDMNIAARAGLGYENGFNFGVGTGFSYSGFSFDIALTSHIAPFTSHRSFGLTTSIGF